MVLWLDFVICLCYVCSLVCTLLSLFVLIYVCQCTEVTHTRAPTQHHPPTRSFSRGHTADSLPTCVVVTEGGFTKFHSLTFWWLTSQRKLHQAPIAHLEVAQLTFSSNSLIS